MRIVHGNGEDVGFYWSDVLRIGYRTTDFRGDDHFLEFHLEGGLFVQVSLSWPGAGGLSDHVHELPDAKFGVRGILANVIGNESIVVWPAEEAGASLDSETVEQPWMLAPFRWAQIVMSRLDDWLESRHPQPPSVSFDGERVMIVGEDGEDGGFAWGEVRRIGYRTLDFAGDAYFLEFHVEGNGVVRITLGWPGARALSAYIMQIPDTRLDEERGILEDATGNQSIVVWPPGEAGASLDGGPVERPSA